MKNTREILLALLILGTTYTGCSAQPSRSQPAPPLTKPASVSEEVWLKDWANKLVANASLKAGENHIYPNNYPVYSVRLSIENKTGHRLTTGGNLYLIQTAKQSRENEPTTDLLRVIDGYFKQPPLEDYAGAVEIRGERLIDRERMGLIDWVTTENRGGFYSTLAAFLHIGSFRSRHPGAQNFGEAPPGGRLVIDSEELQLSIAVKPERLADVYIVSPLMEFGANSEARFRYLVRFEGGNRLTEMVLVPMTAEALGRIIADNSAPLWKRVFAARWAGLHLGANSGPMLLTAAQDRSAAMRAAVLDGMGFAKYAPGFDTVLKVAQDPKEHPTLRRAAITALGQLTDRRATPFLLSTASGADTVFRDAALKALASLGDPAAREPVLKLLETGAVSSEDMLLPLIDESVLDRLRIAANNPKANSRAALRAIAKLGTPRAMNILSELYQKFDVKGRLQVCAALEGIDKPEAVSILKMALQEQDQSLRYWAMTSLGSVKSPERTEVFLGLLSGPDSDTVRSAIEVVSRARIAEVRPRLLAILNDRALKPDLRRSAAQALGYYPGTDSVRALIGVLTDSEKDVRIEAAQTLGIIPGTEQIPALTKALADSEMLVRLYAARAIADLEGQASCAVLAESLVREDNSAAADAMADGLIRVGCRDPKLSIPLIGRLDSTDIGYRRAVGRYLSFASGKTFDTGYDASPAILNAAKAAWTTWSTGNR